MRLADIAGIGILFAVCVIAGFALGVWAARVSGASWAALAGIFGGLIAGAALAALRFRQALR